MPPFAEAARVTIARSISAPYVDRLQLNAERRRHRLDRAILSRTNCKDGTRMTTTRLTLGAISFSSSNHFALMPYSKLIKPVAFPPGRARLSTKPAPTGSGTFANTIGGARHL